MHSKIGEKKPMTVRSLERRTADNQIVPLNNAPGQPAAAALTRFQGKTHRKQSILSQFKPAKIKWAYWVWADKFSQATTANLLVEPKSN